MSLRNLCLFGSCFNTPSLVPGAVSHTSPASLCSGPSLYCPPRAASTDDQRKILKEYIDAVVTKKDILGGFCNHVTDDPPYIQHDPDMQPYGKRPTMEFLLNIPAYTDMNLTVLRFGIDDNLGWVHIVGCESPEPGSCVQAADIYRFEGTCIMEHWAVIQREKTNKVNELSMW
ncbi:hypothetical protein RRF57_001937 [Xylaria bambusicola]|uniref:SnoaL-like domain-containing protein n=1 Tax=Xylaria bambusicola TaxID=326684 RepID=A0AAN7Z1B5_9PEZI